MKVRLSDVEWANVLKGLPFLEERGRQSCLGMRPQGGRPSWPRVAGANAC